jgi:hypothetical protein
VHRGQRWLQARDRRAQLDLRWRSVEDRAKQMDIRRLPTRVQLLLSPSKSKQARKILDL